MSTPAPKNEPLTPAVLHVMLALAAEVRHGYAIMQEVDRSGGGLVRMGPGTLYGTLQRLEEKGWVRESTRRPNDDDDPRRRYYELTEHGRVVLDAEVERLESVVAEGRRILAGRSA